MHKEQIFRDMYSNMQKRDAYFDKLPADINMAFIDNYYVNNLLFERDILIDAVFGEHAEAVSWFFYEWKPGMKVYADMAEAEINSIDEYIDWMKRYEGFQ